MLFVSLFEMFGMGMMIYVIVFGFNWWGWYGDLVCEIVVVLEVVGGVVVWLLIVVSVLLGLLNCCYVNVVVLIEMVEDLVVLFVWLKWIECVFGCCFGWCWGSWVIDFDIILWLGGVWLLFGLIVLYVVFWMCDFVLGLFVMFVFGWCDLLMVWMIW